MAAPSKRAMTRLGELFRGRREYLPIQWPGLEGVMLKLQALSHQEIQEAEAAAHERMRALKIDLNALTADTFEFETAVQILHRAARDFHAPETTSFAVDADDLRENVRSGDMGTVMGQWKLIQTQQNPASVPDEVWADIVDAVKKKDSARLRASVLGLPETSTPTTGSPPPA